MMQYWLMKSEPDVWSIDQQKKAGVNGAPWDGVRNYQAAKYMKQMKIGDECLFYSSVKEKAIKGIMRVSKEYYPDHTDKKKIFGMVDVTYVRDLKEVYLSEIKADPFFAAVKIFSPDPRSKSTIPLKEPPMYELFSSSVIIYRDGRKPLRSRVAPIWRPSVKAMAAGPSQGSIKAA